MLWVIILVLLVAGATVHASRAVPHPTRGRVTEIFLVYLLAGYYGVAMLLAAVVHLSNPAGIANLKGWPPSEPFQTLYAFALLGLAGSAFLSIWWRGSYLLGPALFGSVLLLGGAYLHGSEVLHARRFVLLKDGPEVLLDLVAPLAVLSLAWVYRRTIRSAGEARNSTPAFDGRNASGSGGKRTEGMRGPDRSRVIRFAAARACIPGPAGEHAVSLLQRATLNVKLSSPVRPNQQTPHAQDEVYVIVRGRGVLVHDGKRDEFQVGDLLFVAAGTEHHFEDFTDDLAVWVVFFGPQGGEVPTESTV